MKNKIDRLKVFIDLAKDNYVLTRLEDNKQITASTIKFVEWNEDGTGKYVYNDPAIGRSIIADGQVELTYKWLTTPITEIISETKFKTKNSTYTLHKV